MNNNQINYNNAMNQEYDIYPFNNNGTIEDLIVHKFTKDENGKIVEDSVVIGKISTEIVSDPSKRMEIKYWLKQFKYLTEQCKMDSEERKYKLSFFNFLKLRKNAVTEMIEFTQEGYDLMTGKYMYTDGIIEKTVDIPFASKTQISTYNIINKQNKVLASDGVFYPFKEYNDNYLFNSTELESLSPEQLMGYLDRHKYKLERLFQRKNWLVEQYPKKDDMEVAVLTALQTEYIDPNISKGRAM